MNRKGGRGNGCCFFFLLIVLVAAAADIAAAQDSSPSGRGPSHFNRQSFNPSMAIIIVVLVTAFFFLGFFSIYIRRCAGAPLGGPGEHPGSRPGGIMFLTTMGAARSRRMRGVDLDTLETFPTMAYADVKAHKASKGELECAVCLSEFEDDDTLRLLTKCSHAFHADCIDAWLSSHVTCPVCRANLLADAEAPAAPDSASAASTVLEQGVLAATAQQPAQETPTAPPEQVTVVIAGAEETEEEKIRKEEAAELVRIRSVKRALRSKSGRTPAQFPRSHTTGHSLAVALALPEESTDRYTLRLPDHVLQEVIAAGKLRRTRSLTAFREGGVGGSTRRGFGSGRAGRSVRLGQSGRWPNMSFLPRTLTFSAWGSVRRGEADVSGKGSKVAGDGKAAEQQCEGGACALPLGERV
uniref:Uncharacterized protein n=1 Tax=Avena sativa TaxID=4498 RepID=A0ACD5Y6V7_AVESA